MPLKSFIPSLHAVWNELKTAKLAAMASASKSPIWRVCQSCASESGARHWEHCLVTVDHWRYRLDSTQAMDQTARRLTLKDLSKDQIFHLDDLMSPEWSDTWRDFAYSFYCTLLSRTEPMTPVDAAELAETLVFAVGEDLGGTQPYIPVVPSYASSERYELAMSTIRRNRSYKLAVDACRLAPQATSADHLASLEALVSFPWSEVWRDLACSIYRSLLSHLDSLSPADATSLTKALVFGIGTDLGGTQPYIGVGRSLVSKQRVNRALGLLRQGYTYKQAADECGVTVSRMRIIERESRKGPCRRAS